MLAAWTKTAPYTWHGWQKDLGAAVKKSYTETMFGKEPTDDEVKAVVAFLGTLDHPTSPYRGPKLSPAIERGKKVFESKGRCLTCHKGEEYTSKSNYDVKVEEDGSSLHGMESARQRGGGPRTALPCTMRGRER